MTDRKLKEFALKGIGMLYTILHQQKQIKRIKDKHIKEHKQKELNSLIEEYTKLLEELRHFP